MARVDLCNTARGLFRERMELDLRNLDLGALPTRIFNPPKVSCPAFEAGELDDLDGAETWELLATRDAIPMEWISAPNRVFVRDEQCSKCALWSNESVCSMCGGLKRSLPHLRMPESQALAVALASDLSGVSSAERLAHEIVHRLRVWNAGSFERIAWMQIDPDIWRYSDTSPLDAVLWTAGNAARSAVDASPRRTQSYAHRRFQSTFWGLPLARSENYGLARLIELSMCWESAVANELVVPQSETFPASVRGRTFASMPSPFVAALFLWATGYGWVGGFGRAIVLAAAIPRSPQSRIGL